MIQAITPLGGKKPRVDTKSWKRASASSSWTFIDCRGYSVVKCTTRRWPLVHADSRGLRPQSAEGSARKRIVSGGACLRGRGRSHLHQRPGTRRVRRDDRHGRQACSGFECRSECAASAAAKAAAAPILVLFVSAVVQRWRDRAQKVPARIDRAGTCRSLRLSRRSACGCGTRSV